MSYFEEIGLFPESKSLLWRYVGGYVFCLAATLVAYVHVAYHLLPTAWLVILISVLALMQCFMQAYCFLHVSTAKASRGRLVIMGFAFLVVLIIVSGSLWIMTHLNERMMESPALQEQYMQNQDSF